MLGARGFAPDPTGGLIAPPRPPVARFATCGGSNFAAYGSSFCGRRPQFSSPPPSFQYRSTPLPVPEYTMSSSIVSFVISAGCDCECVYETAAVVLVYTLFNDTTQAGRGVGGDVWGLE